MGKNAIRLLYITLGMLFVSLGALGAILPVLPTVPFMLLALWCFANSSERLHEWLYHHKLFGPPLQRWKQYRVIPLHTKIIATSNTGCTIKEIIIFHTLVRISIDIVFHKPLGLHKRLFR